MIFNKDYDMSLWLMLSSNKESSKVVANFIRDIPEELCQKIRESLMICSIYDSVNKDISFEDRDLLDIKGNVSKDEDISYCYCIDMVTGSLEIVKKIAIDSDMVNKIKFTLYPIKIDDYKKNNSSENISIGSIVDALIDENSADMTYVYSISFDLMKSLFNRLAVESFDHLLYCKYLNFVKIDMLPENFDLSDLNVDNLNNLVRRKKKRNSK